MLCAATEKRSRWCACNCCSNRRTWVVRCTLFVCLLAVGQYCAKRAILAHRERQKIPTGLLKRRPRSVDVPWQNNRAFFFPNSKQNAEKMEKTSEKLGKIFNENHTITLGDLQDLTFDDVLPEVSWEEASEDRQPILDILDRAGLKVDVHVLQRLPTWSQVVKLYGEKPVVVGKETCAVFRDRVPKHSRFVGVAGQMNTGTNALAKYLTNNIRIEENEQSKGILWTVPWYKHGWASLKGQYMYRVPDNHDNVLAVVSTRDPYYWMQSMCESPYTFQWNKSKTHCPNLVENGGMDKNVPVQIRWGRQFSRSWESWAHVWSSWYREYRDSDMPRIMIRFEDLLFHTQQVVEEIRACVDAEWKQEEFQFVGAPAKTHPYFARYKAPSSLVSAMIKYGQDDDGTRRIGTMTDDDLDYAEKHVDQRLLDDFHYQSSPKS